MRHKLRGCREGRGRIQTRAWPSGCTRCAAGRVPAGGGGVRGGTRRIAPAGAGLLTGRRTG